MGHDSRAVANFFLIRAQEKNIKLTHLQIQKLVYFAHGWTLGATEQNLIRDAVEAWKLGPVIRTIYDEFRPYGGDPICGLAKGLDAAGSDLVAITSNFSELEKQIMGLVFDTYGNMDGYQLSDLTHAKGSPWDIVRNVQHDTVIPNEIIKDHFKKLIGAAKSQQPANV